LGARGTGVYSYYYSIANYFVLFAMLGLDNYGNRSIAAARDDPIKLENTFSGIYCMQFITASIVIFSYILYAVLVQKEIMAYIMLIYVVSALFDINWFFFGLECFKVTVTRNIIVKFLSLICIFVFVKEESDVYIYGLILSCSFLISQIIMWAFIKRYTTFIMPTWKEVVGHFKPNFFLFIPVIAVSLYKTMDKVMLGKLTEMAEVGYYENAEKIISIPVSLVQSLGTVMLPRMTNLITHNNKEMSQKYIHNSLLFASFLSSAMCFGIAGISKEFIPFFYGEGFEACIEILTILAPSTVFMAVANVIRTQFLIPNSEDSIYLTSVILGAIVNFIINYQLIPLYYSKGAAIGTLMAEAIVCIYQFIMVRKKIRLDEALVNSVPFYFSGIIMYVILQKMHFDVEFQFLALLFKIISGAIIYVLVLSILLYVRKIILKKESILQE